MASKTLILLEDDTDGSTASETVTFGLDGATYEIDLSDNNAAALRSALADWISHARRTGGRRGNTAPANVSQVDAKAVRAWASSNGIELNTRGRVPAEVVEKYRAAGN